MDDKPKRKRGRPPKVREAPAFITGADIAHHFGVSREQFYRWVYDCTFPPPWAQPGERTRVWRRDHWDEFVATGTWPREAWKGRD